MVSIVMLLLIAYVAVEMVPIAITTFQLSQAMSQEVMYGPVNEPAAFIHTRLMGEARHLGLDLDPKRMVVAKTGPNLHIRASYSVRVEFFDSIGFDWYFNPEHRGTRRPPAFGGG